MQRKKCVCCNSTNLISLYGLESFPSSSSQHIVPTYDIEHLNFCYCNNCFQVQLKTLCDLKILYKTSHNSEIVGDTWKNHFKKLHLFICENIPDICELNVLDIGDPVFKLGREFKNFKGEWHRIDPNCEEYGNQPNIKIYKKFFDNDFCLDSKIDVVIHSHLFEHMYDPLIFLEHIRTFLPNNGLMCFSVPNMTYIAHNCIMPFAGVFFEHTFHLGVITMEYMLLVSGFKIKYFQPFQNHSNFYIVQKIDRTTTHELDNLIVYNKHILTLFNDSLLYVNKMKEILRTYCEISNIYVYSSHYNTQVLLHNENTCKIISILDNDVNKQGKYLNNMNIMTYSPTILKDKGVCVVMVSHCGYYKNEIINCLNGINDKLILI